MLNKVIFVAFAIEDEIYRNHLKVQSLRTPSPFEYIDMSVKEAYASAWKEKVRARIRRSDGVIVLVSRNSLEIFETKLGNSMCKRGRQENSWTPHS